MSYRLGYLKDFFQQESGCFSQEACVHLVKRCTLGFFFSLVGILFLCLTKVRVANAGLTRCDSAKEGTGELTEGGTYCVRKKRGVVPRIL